MKKKRKSTLKDYLVPHGGNGYKPLILCMGGVTIVLLLILLLEAGYLLGTKYAFNNSSFLASVLPGVLVDLTNSDRVDQGVAPLTSDALLASAAQMKADDMAQKGYFSHVSPDGKSPWYWLDQVGYAYSYAGENLAVDFTDSKNVEEAWMASPAHHANLVKPQYTRVGIGVAQGNYEGHATTFVVQLFATPTKVAATKEAVNPVAAVVQTSPTVATAAVVTEVAPTRVLGAEIAPSQPAPSFLVQVAASPYHTVAYLLAGLAALFAVLLMLALVVHVRIQFIEVLVGGLVIILAALSLLGYNAATRTGEVPLNTQTASVIQAL